MKSLALTAIVMSALSAAPAIAQSSNDVTSQDLQTLSNDQRAALISVLAGLPRQ